MLSFTGLPRLPKQIFVPASTTSQKVIISVSAVGGVLVLLACIAFLGFRNRTLNKDVFGKVHAPNVGPDTTIVVVKIQVCWGFGV